MTASKDKDTLSYVNAVMPGKIKSGRAWDFAAVGLLIVLAGLLFRRHLSGALTFFGNPDRLNNNLKILKHHIDSLAAGHLSAWSDTELLGYDTFSLPYTFPNPITFLTYWSGPENIYITAGFVSMVLLALAGISAYAALRKFVPGRSAAVVGAILYQFSTITILKVSQNNMSFAVFTLIPLFIIAIRDIGAPGLSRSFLILSSLGFILLQFTFLQKAAYALLLSGTYALYRSWNTRDWRPAGVFTAAMFVAIIAASPRIWSMVIAMGQYTRGDTGHGPQIILGHEILRWLDNTIFGRSYSDPVALQNGFNLSEGFLLYISSFAPILVFLGLIHYRSRWFGLLREPRNDTLFFVCFLVFIFSVFIFKPVLILLYYLFLKVDFIHARILIVGLFPMVLIISLLLSDLPSGKAAIPRNSHMLMASIAGIALAVLIVLGIEMAAGLARGAWRAHTVEKLYLDRGAITRIALSTAVAIIMILLLKHRALSPVKAQTIFVALCLAIAGQTLRAADFQINGAHTRTGPLPFKNGGFYWSKRTDFRVPSNDVLEKLDAGLQRDLFRSVVICDPHIAGGFCAAHIGEFWKLRLADGYYGMGVPKRIAALPWTAGLGLRHVIFASPEGLPWQLLGFLNVKYAVIADDALYRNVLPPLDGEWPDLARHRPEVIENPAKVVPRAFFASRVEPVDTARSATSKIFTDATVADVTQTSYAEGLKITETFATSGQIKVTGRGDRLVLTFDKSDKLRFLVLNELFYPGWAAQVDGRDTRIYPTNAVMRGVLVPPGAASVMFFYEPFVKTGAAKLLYASGLMLAVIGVMGFRRLSREPR